MTISRIRARSTAVTQARLSRLRQARPWDMACSSVNPKAEDINVNVCKKKQLTNTRASGSDEALKLTPPIQMSLEACLEFLADDELLEVTPNHLRIRKKILNNQLRAKARAKA